MVPHNSSMLPLAKLEKQLLTLYISLGVVGLTCGTYLKTGFEFTLSETGFIIDGVVEEMLSV